ncbi:MAG: GAF domain-containing protein [Gammaproteobacteria bacterium]|nr:GAF domain-containing protein [Gammaproteobacteria bacterium]
MKKSRSQFISALAKMSFGRFNLRTKLTLGNMLITFIAIIGMGYYVYFRNQESNSFLTTQLESSVRNKAENNLSTLSNEQSTLLEGFFASMRESVSTISSTENKMLSQEALLNSGAYWDASISLSRLSSGSWDNSNAETSSIFIPAKVELTDKLISKINVLKQTELIVPSILESNPDIIAIYFGGVSGETIYYPNIDLAAIVPPDFDVTGRPWFVEAAPVNNLLGKVVWSAPYQDAALNGLVITASKPVFNSKKEFQGVSAMDIQLNRITSLISNIHVGKTGYAFLVDSNNRLIALPRAGYADFGVTEDTVPLGEILDQAKLSGMDPEFFAVLKEVVLGNNIKSITLGGVEKYIAYQQIPEVKYSLAIIVPSDELLAEAITVNAQVAQETRNTIMVSIILVLIILTIASLATLGIGNRLTAPLKALTGVANEIIAGNFDVKAEIQDQDEIGTLAETLNVMTSTLREMIHSLEKRVEERTTALKDELKKGEYRGRQFETITKVSQAINAAQNLQELLPNISQVVSEQFNFYHVGIFLIDASNQYATLSAANSPGGKIMLKRGHQLKIGEQGIVGYVTGTGLPRIALDVGEDSVYFNNPDLPDTHSEMALPLKIGGKVFGALDVQSTERNAFTNDDVDVLSTLAEQVSLAIQNARLFDQTQNSLAEAEAIYRQHSQDSWSQLPKELKLTGFRYNASGSTPLSETETIGRIEEGKDQASEKHSGRQEVSVPIMLRGKTIGTLSVQVPKTERVSGDQIDLIKAVADRVALSAENARLFEETTSRATRERVVSDITNKIRSTNDPQEMIKTATAELQRVLGATRVEIIPQKNIPSPDK